MTIIFIIIGFLVLANMQPRSIRSRRDYYQDYPPQDYSYYQRPMPYNLPNTEGGYPHTQRGMEQQRLYYTFLFLLTIIAFLLYNQH